MKSVKEDAADVHYCHARPLCKVPVPPALLFCKRHWAMVPADMQEIHLANFRKRYKSKADRDEFIASLKACVDYVKEKIANV